jgi:hypothetical protein
MQPAHRPAPSPRLRRRRINRTIVLLLMAIFFLPIGARATIFYFDDAPRGWSQASWSSIGSLPPAMHSWIVVKPTNGASWTRYDVVGWGNPIRTNGWAPDGRWRGNDPVVSTDVRGAAAEALIPKIEAAVKEYQWRNAGDYRAWPGPNSNTFVANVLRAVPEISANLPANAIGRDFRPEFYFGLTDSRTGIELNLWGFAGFKVGWVEGIELNFLSLVTGIDLRGLAVKLPAFGNIGLSTIDIPAAASPNPASD